MEIRLVGKKLTITADLSNGVPSKSSGKNLVVASTGGFTGIANSEYKMSLLVIKPIK